jgi:DNA-binding response OmpR family regulator
MGDAQPVVLVVDDDEDHVIMLEVALEASGYEVLTAHSVASAGALLASRPVDALVADLTLGDGTALDLFAAAGLHRPRVAIVLSGLDSPEDVDRSLGAGFDAHLVKPTSLDRLSAVLDDALRRRKSGMRLARTSAPEPKAKRDAG